MLWQVAPRNMATAKGMIGLRIAACTCFSRSTSERELFASNRGSQMWCRREDKLSFVGAHGQLQVVAYAAGKEGL